MLPVLTNRGNQILVLIADGFASSKLLCDLLMCKPTFECHIHHLKTIYRVWAIQVFASLLYPFSNQPQYTD